MQETETETDSQNLSIKTFDTDKDCIATDCGYKAVGELYFDNKTRPMCPLHLAHKLLADKFFQVMHYEMDRAGRAASNLIYDCITQYIHKIAKSHSIYEIVEASINQYGEHDEESPAEQETPSTGSGVCDLS